MVRIEMSVAAMVSGRSQLLALPMPGVAEMSEGLDRPSARAQEWALALQLTLRPWHFDCGWQPRAPACPTLWVLHQHPLLDRGTQLFQTLWA